MLLCGSVVWLGKEASKAFARPAISRLSRDCLLPSSFTRKNQ